jgi:uncharacterized protein
MLNPEEIFEALKDNDIDKVDDFLSKNPQLINTRAENGETLFLLTVYYGRKEIRELLLQKGYLPDHFEAAASGNLARIKELLEDNRDLVNTFSEDGFTPLGLAAFFGHLEIVRYLLSINADVNIRANNNFRVMPLHSAVASKNYEIVKLLLEYGADPNAKQQQDITPIHQAADNGDLEMIKLLLKHHADKNVRTKSSITPVDFARKKGYDKVVDFLLQD